MFAQMKLPLDDAKIITLADVYKPLASQGMQVEEKKQEEKTKGKGST
jgi:hypothetical protein